MNCLPDGLNITIHMAINAIIFYQKHAYLGWNGCKSYL